MKVCTRFLFRVDSKRSKAEAESPQNDVFYPETTTRTYDASGNADTGVSEVYGALSSLQMGVVRHARSKSFYSADQRLRYFQENVLTGGSSVAKQGVWEEYRYDPLGRRVLVRSNRDDLCSGGGSGACVSHVTRFVWSGDQLLWELRLDSQPGANLEAAYTIGPYHGRVSYFHAGGIDRPLVIRKEGQPAIIPHENWRGQFSRGTYTSGAVSDCGPGQTAGCTPVNWPGHRTNAWHQRSGGGPDIRTWFGGLVDGMRDASGQMYMRNRYYDPETGQFTQTDPIGLAGGLNAYGFAAGDPVSHWDPSGLACEKKGDDRLVCPDVGPGDYRTLRDFLGGSEGQSAYTAFEEAGLTQWNSRSCRGGFTPAQCDRIADAQASLTLHSNAFCSALGVRSTKRFQSGRFGWRPDAGGNYFGMSTPFNPFGAFRITRLSPIAFDSGELANTIAHEEFHYQRPFASESRANSTGYACAGPI